jgi:hypothetical protein
MQPVEENGVTIGFQICDYIRFQINPHDDEPVVLGTMGRGQPITSEPLYARPWSGPLPTDGLDNSDLTILAARHSLTTVRERAMIELQDMGISADVYRIRKYPAKLRALNQRKELIDQLRATVEGLEHDWQQENVAFERARDRTIARLVAAKVRSRLLRHYQYTNEVEDPAMLTPPEEPSGSSSLSSSITRQSPCSRYGLNWEVRATRNRCKLCGMIGHFAMHCDTPHYWCTTQNKGRCLVPLKHEHFNAGLPRSCPYGGRNTKRRGAGGPTEGGTSGQNEG